MIRNTQVQLKIITHSPTSRKSHTLDCHLLPITPREDQTMQIAISPTNLTVIAAKHTVSDYAPLWCDHAMHTMCGISTDTTHQPNAGPQSTTLAQP